MTSIAFLATGDEIIQGDTLNTNTHYMAQGLHSDGFAAGYHLACDDKRASIRRCLDFLASTHQIIIITGGLGPTSDDNTRFALAEHLDLPLVLFPKALEHVTNRLSRAGLLLTEGNKQQALFPEQAKLLDNPNGTAMGCMLEHQGRQYVLLPGPPKECLPMFDNLVLPELAQTRRQDRIQLKWRVFGLPEGAIAETIDKVLADLDCETGYRLEVPYLECKVRCLPALADAVNQRMTALLQSHILPTQGMRASLLLSRYLEQETRRIAIIDSATGGLLENSLLRPATRNVLHFQPRQDDDLRFEVEGLDAYWQKVETSQTHIRIRVSNQTQELVVFEKTLAFRNAHVLLMGSEWSAYAIYAFLNGETVILP